MRPSELGAPARFDSWRPGQDRAFQHLLDSNKRFDTLALPVGIGKSLIAVLYPTLLAQRAVILTSTKGLQDQYQRDFSEQTVDLRGMTNYPCRLAVEEEHRDRTPSCDEGVCWDGVDCKYGPPQPDNHKCGCHYFDAWARAYKSQIVVTSYAMWFSMLNSGRDLGTRDVLVCDEAHDAPAQVAAAVGCVLAEDELDLPVDAEGWEITKEWRTWAGEKEDEVRLALERSATPWERRKLRDLGRRVGRLAKATGDWVMSAAEERGRKEITFEPLWPKPYAEEWLFRGIPKVMLLSATITPKTLEYLGIDRHVGYFLEVPSPFPAARRPIIHIPTVKVNRHSTESEMRIWASRIDQIIRGRLDRKGIVHTVSYARAKLLKELSEYSKIMLVPRSGSETRQAVEDFKKSAPPKILVSPSIHTGYDFPDDYARYQVIGKMPFPDNRDPICAARCKADPEYMLWSAITTLVQTSGRIVRSERDSGETFIVDDMVNTPWVLKVNGKHLPRWWKDAYRSQGLIPPAMGIE